MCLTEIEYFSTVKHYQLSLYIRTYYAASHFLFLFNVAIFVLMIEMMSVNIKINKMNVTKKDKQFTSYPFMI